MFPRNLRIEVGVLLAIKVVALSLIYYVLVAPAVVSVDDPATIRSHLVGNTRLESAPHGSR